jgi:bile acid:Na+ symporter, BASS family
MTLINKISSFAGKYFVLWVIIASVCGYFNPGLFMWVKAWIKILLGIIMFGMGMTLNSENLKEIMRRPREVLLGVLAQYTIMPLLAWSLATLLNLPPELAIGVILLGCCPGGTASNVITFLARGDVALSVAMTSASTLLAPFLTPLLTYLLGGKWIEVSTGALFISIIQIVIIPVLLGYLAHRYFTRTVKKCTPVLPLISVAAITLIVGFVIGANSERLFKTAPKIFIAVILHNAFGLLIGYRIGKMLGMNIKKCRTLSIEIGMQNSGLAVALSSAHFTAAATIPGAIFSLWHNITGPLLATIWSRNKMKIKKPEF